MARDGCPHESRSQRELGSDQSSPGHQETKKVISRKVKEKRKKKGIKLTLEWSGQQSAPCESAGGGALRDVTLLKSAYVRVKDGPALRSIRRAIPVCCVISDDDWVCV